MAKLTSGVGVNSPPWLRRTCTPLAASTRSAVFSAGAESAWVSAPMYSGPLMPAPARYSQTAWVIARICASLNVLSRLLPRWPLVPNDTRWRGSAGSGVRPS